MLKYSLILTSYILVDGVDILVQSCTHITKKRDVTQQWTSL